MATKIKANRTSMISKAASPASKVGKIPAEARAADAKAGAGWTDNA
jgi:hypothetical protein